MNDALERLKNRNRPTVPNRDASLTPISTIADTSISRSPEVQVSTPSEVQTPIAQELMPSLQTKQSTLRLEVGVSDRLQEICRDNGICREVLIEAMFEFCEQHPEALQGVLAEATTRNEQRQQVANQKRAKSMMQRFGQSAG
jgi:hypothetical protein